MSDLLSTVDQKTKLAGENRLELLLFNLGTDQFYGINVFKVKEIIEYIPLTNLPGSDPVVRGIANMRGTTFAVFDMAMAIGYQGIKDYKDSLIIISEYNKTVQGFLVSKVSKIVNLEWSSMHKPPPGAGINHYLTAITNIDNNLVEVIDVEKILQNISPVSTEISAETKEKEAESIEQLVGNKVLICDDSRIARKQLKKTLEQMNIEVIEKYDGKETLELLKSWTKGDQQLPEDLLMLISDIEMPEMDGYKLTTEIRNDPKLKDMHVVLHSSLSGVFNEALVKKVGADRFIPKFNPDVIVSGVSSVKRKGPKT